MPREVIFLGVRAGRDGGSDRLGREPGATQAAWLDRWGALLVIYAALAALCRPLTLTAAAAVLLPGIALLALMVWRLPERQPPVFRGSFLPWVVLALLLGGWELTAMVWGNDSAHPTLSLLLDPLLDTYPGRLVGWLGWLALGRWLVTR